MDFLIREGGVEHDAELVLRGEANVADLREAVRALDRDELSSGRNLRLLIDLTELDTTTVSAEDLEQASTAAAERDFYAHPRAVALVAPGDGTHDVAVRWRAHLGGSASRRQVFRDRAAALVWLEQHA
jgi:hypothetical protein